MSKACKDEKAVVIYILLHLSQKNKHFCDFDRNSRNLGDKSCQWLIIHEINQLRWYFY